MIPCLMKSPKKRPDRLWRQLEKINHHVGSGELTRRTTRPRRMVVRALVEQGLTSLYSIGGAHGPNCLGEKIWRKVWRKTLRILRSTKNRMSSPPTRGVTPCAQFSKKQLQRVAIITTLLYRARCGNETKGGPSTLME